MDNLSLSDEEAVEKIQLGDRELYQLIMQRYQSKLLRYVSSLIKDSQAAADIVQESFIKAFANLKGFDTKKKFSSWIYRIAHNESVNSIKKNRREVSIPEDIDFEGEEDSLKDFERGEAASLVEKCLEDMPLAYSEPLALFYIEGKSYEEISDILRLPLGTVSTRISRAKIIMKKICQNMN